MAIDIREIEKRPSYIYVRIGERSYQDNDMSKIMQWCKDRECGKMVNNYAVSFKNEDEFTMFRLTWC
jgi:hypothetical protein